MEILLIVIASITRLIPHPFNFTAIGAIALFTGANLNKKYIWIPFASLFLTDIILGFHNTMVYVYPAFALTILIGYLIRKKQNILSIPLASITSSILFFIITNFGVWQLWSNMYPHTIEGLIACYIAGIPFFKNSLTGDLVYTCAIFGAYHYPNFKSITLKNLVSLKKLDKNIPL